VLFGSIATVTREDVAIIAILSLVILLTITLLWKELTAIAFDEELAETGGIPTRVINTVFVMLTAVTVSVSMRVVGILLIGALMVIPVNAAMQWGRGFRETLLLGVGFSLLSMIAGLTLSYYAGLSSGGTIVLTAMAVFFFSVACRKMQTPR
jgi:zinc transport system permease protein